MRVAAAIALAVAALVLVLGCATPLGAAPPGAALSRATPPGAAPPGAAPPQYPRGSAQLVVFTRYSPLFSNAQIVRRLLSPLAAAAIHDSLARSLEALTPYSLDLTKEKFLVYVPPGPPPSPRGFGLLVFVPPWDEARLPFGWASQLSHYGVIFVTPAKAGNTTVVLSRRVPLAVAAEENIIREYPIDRRHIYIGGFSGGSRVALRIALGYPDVFRGALLNAGADALGGEHPLPPRDLLLRFQSSSHLVYVTGELDTFELAADASSLQSMRDWCVFSVETYETPAVGHELLSSSAFGRALDRLRQGVAPDAARLAACRSRVQTDLAGGLAQAQTLIDNGRPAAARKLLLAIDDRYGGLAAPRIIELARRCKCGLPPP